MLQKKNDLIIEKDIDEVSDSIAIEASIERNYVPSLGDTTEGWRSESESGALKPVEYYWYTTANVLHDQPNQWGHMLSFHPAGVGSEFFQLWKTAPNGDLFHRGCNSTGSLMENQSWRKIIDTSNLNLIYPVNSVYITATNTNPSGWLGGTWELIDKEFAYYYKNDTTQFTPNSTNVSSVGTCQQMRVGHNLFIWLNITPKVALTDSGVELGTLTPATFGVTGFNGVTTAYSFFSDGGQVVTYATLTNAGVVSVQDILQRNNTGSSYAAGTGTNFKISIDIRYTNILDSACDKFYWKRTA